MDKLDRHRAKADNSESALDLADCIEGLNGMSELRRIEVVKTLIVHEAVMRQMRLEEKEERRQRVRTFMNRLGRKKKVSEGRFDTATMTRHGLFRWSFRRRSLKVTTS